MTQPAPSPVNWCAGKPSRPEEGDSYYEGDDIVCRWDGLEWRRFRVNESGLRSLAALLRQHDCYTPERVDGLVTIVNAEIDHAISEVTGIALDCLRDRRTSIQPTI